MGLENKDYLYQEGQEDKVRLEILNDVYNPASQKALLAAGLKKKKCVVEIACGHGQIACWMAQQVGQEAIVIGIDSSEEQLLVARKRAALIGLTNIVFLKADLLELTQNFFLANVHRLPDFIYARWLLVHLKTYLIPEGIRKLYELLAPEGAVLHEELALQDSVIMGAPQSAFNQYIQTFSELAAKLNIDFNLGRSLPQKLSLQGYKNIKQNISRPVFSPEQLQFFPLDLTAAAAILAQQQVATPEKIVLLCDELRRQADHAAWSMTNYLVVGEK